MDCIYVYFLILQYKYSATRIYIYTDIRIYGHTAIHATPVVFFTFTFIYPSISVSGFDLTFRPLAVIHRLLFCKGIAGREHGKHRNAPYWQKTFHDPPKSKIAVS